MTTDGPVVRVVAAMVMEAGQVLLARRGPGMDLAGCWEFPGGKIESGEGPAEALVRELEEELGLRVRADSWVANSDFSNADGRRIRLEGWLATHVAGEPRAQEHDGWCWIQPGRIPSACLAPADQPLLAALIEALDAEMHEALAGGRGTMDGLT